MRWLAAMIALAVACGPTAPPTIAGTYLDPRPAPDFTLVDGLSGRATTLSELRGREVVLAFLFTRCPDVCPLTAQLMRRAQRSLGGDASRVELVAVSVDPAGDTPQAVRDFSRTHELAANWRYLVGPESALRPVWSAYGVRATPDAAGASVSHSDAMFVIDRQGRERALLHSTDPPDDLVALLRHLIAER